MAEVSAVPGLERVLLVVLLLLRYARVPWCLACDAGTFPRMKGRIQPQGFLQPLCRFRVPINGAFGSADGGGPCRSVLQRCLTDLTSASPRRSCNEASALVEHEHEREHA